MMDQPINFYTHKITEFIEFIVNQSFLGFWLLSNFCCNFSCNWSRNDLLGLFLFGLSWLVVRCLGSFSYLLKISVSLCNPSIMEFLVFSSTGNCSFPSFDFIFLLNSLSSDSSLSHQSLDLGGFVSVGIDVLLSFEGSSNGMLFNQSTRTSKSLLVFSLLNSIELSDTSSSLGTKSSWFCLVSESGNFLLSLFNEKEGKSFNVRTNNASSNRFSLSFSSSLSSVSAGSWGEEQFDSVVAEDTLFHGKSVFIESSSDSEDISLELFAENISFNFLTHSLLVEDSASVVIIDIEWLSSAVCGVGDTELG